MLDRQKANLVDGYTALKAARRAARSKGHGDDRPRKAAEETADTGRSGAEKRSSGVHIARTVRPESHEIVCYECGYVFRLSGRAQRSFCPRCRTVLDMVDYTLETEWNEDLKTAGTIRLTREAVLVEGVLVAGDIILEGRVVGGSLRAARRLLIRPGTAFPEGRVTARVVEISPGADVKLRGRGSFENIEVAGSLKGRFQVEGLVRIRCGGLLQGEVEAARLIVEEGGGLKAKVKVVRKRGEGKGGRRQGDAAGKGKRRSGLRGTPPSG